jgi:hypothetical protein
MLKSLYLFGACRMELYNVDFIEGSKTWLWLTGQISCFDLRDFREKGGAGATKFIVMHR